MFKSFLAAVLLSASVERCFVSRMRDFSFLFSGATEPIILGLTLVFHPPTPHLPFYGISLL